LIPLFRGASAGEVESVLSFKQGGRFELKSDAEENEPLMAWMAGELLLPV
jgi:hypothetical protein